MKTEETEKKEPTTKPFTDSLWMDCFIELSDAAFKDGKKAFVFKDVDELVIKRSHYVRDYTVDAEYEKSEPAERAGELGEDTDGA